MASWESDEVQLNVFYFLVCCGVILTCLTVAGLLWLLA